MFEVTMKVTVGTLGNTKAVIIKEVTMKARVIMTMIAGISNVDYSVFLMQFSFFMALTL
jgi:hypothetical protein